VAVAPRRETARPGGLIVIAKWEGIVRMAGIAMVGGCTLALVSCNSGSEQQPASVRGSLDAALTAFARGDAAQLCDSLSGKAHAVIGRAMHGLPPLECVRDVRPFLKNMGRYRGGATVIDVARQGPDHATVRLRLPDRTPATIPFSRVDGRWKLDGLFDASLSRIQLRGTPREETVMLERRPTPVRRGGVVVRDLTAPGSPRCPAIGVARFPVLSGGCLMTVGQESARLSLRTAFGAMRFAECDLFYDVRLDGSGGGWVEDIGITGGDPCFDVLSCWDREREKVPWPAQLERYGRQQIRLRIDDVCLDTCVGRFEGRWDVEMVERANGWRLRSASTIGTSGWSFDGSVASDGKPIGVGR
jgi:hypothetical protein